MQNKRTVNDASVDFHPKARSTWLAVALLDFNMKTILYDFYHKKKPKILSELHSICLCLQQLLQVFRQFYFVRSGALLDNLFYNIDLTLS